MKNILFVNDKNTPNWFDELKKKYTIVVEKNVVSAFNSVFKNVPDIILFNLSESVFDAYHLIKLLKNTPPADNIPVVIVSDKKYILPCMDFSDCSYINPDMNSSDIFEFLNNTISNNKLSISQKKSIIDLKITPQKLKLKTQNILDEIVLNSSIVDEFKRLAESINYEDVLSANIFEILKKYLNFDISGLFFNDSDEYKRNVFNLAIPNNNADIALTEKVRDEFFDEIEKYKNINEIQCNLITGDIIEKSKLSIKSFKSKFIIPIFSTGTLVGGFYLASTKKQDLLQEAFLNIILKELELIFKFKYMLNEHITNALYDPMTRLFNKREFEADIEKEFHRARRYIFNFTLAMMDIDYLSKINEKYGREFGDFVIVELSRVLKEVFRRTDIIYRYGGEEIIILLPSTPIEKSLIPIERLRDKIAHHTFKKDGIETNVTVSIGLCANYSQFTQPEQLVNSVECALLRAKERGRNSVDIFEDR